MTYFFNQHIIEDFSFYIYSYYFLYIPIIPIHVFPFWNILLFHQQPDPEETGPIPVDTI